MAKKRSYDNAMSKQDGGMIGGTSALLPENVIMKKYPKGSGYLPEGLNDGLSGIDKQVSADTNDAKKGLSPDKY